MNDTDKKQFAYLMAGVGEAFQKDLSKPALRIYWEVLKPYTLEEVEQAVFKLLKTRTITGTIPVPAEIIQAMDSRQASLPSAAEVWDLILKAAEAGMDKPDIPDPASKALSVVGGYRELTKTSYESLRYAFPKFQSAYNEMADRERYAIRSGEALPGGQDRLRIGCEGHVSTQDIVGQVVEKVGAK